MSSTNQSIKAYLVPIILVASIVLGGLTGCFFKSFTAYLQPIGAIFLNLLLTAVVPLIFFSIAAAIAKTNKLAQLGRIFLYMFLVFLFTGLVAATLSIIVVKIYPPALDAMLLQTAPAATAVIDVPKQIVAIFTVPGFYKLFSHKHILALVLFAILVGLAAASTRNKSQAFIDLLQAGEVVFMRVFTLVMYTAPLGFFAYFAVLVSELGPQVVHSYLHIAILYYVFGIFYFLVVLSIYAYLAAQTKGLRLFWSSVFLPMITSLATCSSAASIPANLLATKKMAVPTTLCETVVPIGSIIHKDGSVIGGIFKIAFLFGMFHLPFSGFSTIAIAIGVGVLVGTVMGAIPSGGLLGELLILNVYGFPPNVLIAIAAISIIIDPLATMINVTGNSVSSMLIARLVVGKKWAMEK